MATIDVQVPAGGSALAEALAHAASGSRLCLAAGEHDAGLAIPRSLTLVGVEGADRTVLKGAGSGPVLRIDQDGLAVRLEGLTLTGGCADAGGGLSVHGRGKVHLSDCVLAANRAGLIGGGGVYACAGLLEIERTRFADNHGRQGGAVYLDGVVHAQLSRCVFEGNRAERGGALRVAEGVAARVLASRFHDNPSTDSDVAVRVSGTRSRAPTVELNHCEVADGGLLNGPDIRGDVLLRGCRLPGAWRGLAGTQDLGGNTYRST